MAQGESSMAFDWHGDTIFRHTIVDTRYKNTQNVRRFLREHCGPSFAFERDFMAWIGDGTVKTMGDVADEWLRRQHERQGRHA